MVKLAKTKLIIGNILKYIIKVLNHILYAAAKMCTSIQNFSHLHLKNIIFFCQVSLYRIIHKYNFLGTSVCHAYISTVETSILLAGSAN